MKRFGALAILTALVLCGCGNTPKQTAQDFITACSNGNYKKAAGMVYWNGEFLNEIFPELRIGSYASCFHNFSADRNERIMYKLSPRDPVFEAGNPNKCRVCVMTKRFRNGREIETKEVAWPLEKVNGRWIIIGKASDWE